MVPRRRRDYVSQDVELQLEKLKPRWTTTLATPSRPFANTMMAALRPAARLVTANCKPIPSRFVRYDKIRQIPISRAFSATLFRFSKPYDFSAVCSNAFPSLDISNFDQLQSLTSSPPPNTVIIDVREPSEFAEGYIPGAINIPVKSQPEALLLPEDEFEDRFGFPKPELEAHTVFYCRAGVRSAAAAKIAESAGYKDVGDYAGSWLDWTANGGKVAR